jgi:cell division protein FtsI (penicillin-binding protein 3)
LLATSVPEYDVRMDMVTDALTDELFRANIDSLSWHLAELFGDRTQAEYKRDLMDARARRERYYMVKRKADHTQVQQLRTFPLYRLGRFKSGLVTEKRTVRVRPFGRLAARTVGYVLRDSSAIGLEAGRASELMRARSNEVCWMRIRWGGVATTAGSAARGLPATTAM